MVGVLFGATLFRFGVVPLVDVFPLQFPIGPVSLTVTTHETIQDASSWSWWPRYEPSSRPCALSGRSSSTQFGPEWSRSPTGDRCGVGPTQTGHAAGTANGPLAKGFGLCYVPRPASMIVR